MHSSNSITDKYPEDGSGCGDKDAQPTIVPTNIERVPEVRPCAPMPLDPWTQKTTVRRENQ